MQKHAIIERQEAQQVNTHAHDAQDMHENARNHALAHACDWQAFISLKIIDRLET